LSKERTDAEGAVTAAAVICVKAGAACRTGEQPTVRKTGTEPEAALTADGADTD